jgi:hypothetical protein
MNKETIFKFLNEAYRMGFVASGQDWNGERPFGKGKTVDEDKDWLEGRDMDLEDMFKAIEENT